MASVRWRRRSGGEESRLPLSTSSYFPSERGAAVAVEEGKAAAAVAAAATEAGATTLSEANEISIWTHFYFTTS